MDISSKEIIKRNEKLIKSLDIQRLEPLLREYKIFTKAMLMDICNPDTDCDLSSELPTRGPKAFSLFLEILKETGYERVVEKLITFPQQQTFKKYSDCDFYPIKTRPTGHCLIINNERFEKLEFREGSSADVRNLSNFFGVTGLGYTVKEHPNLRGNKIKRCLEDFSQSSFLKAVDCCFIVILSHGGREKNCDVIYGTDGVTVNKYDIINYFNNENCENLRFKPKIFIFQACRGEVEDEGVFVKESSDSVKIVKMPILSDILIVHSSLPNHKAYRNHIDGSWLIQDLISVLSEHYLYEDLERMLKRVTKKMGNRLSKDDNKQVLHTENIHFKDLFHICHSDEFKGYDTSPINYI